MVGVAPPRRQVPNSAGKSVDIEDSCDDNHSFDDLYSSSDENESNEKIQRVVVNSGIGDHSSSPGHYTGGLKKKSLRAVLIEFGQLRSSVKRIADEQKKSLRAVLIEVGQLRSSVKRIADEQVMKKAQMIKKGHVRHKLKMRWFVLTSTDLFYYETKESLVKKGLVVLNECARVEVMQDKNEKDTRYPNRFKVVNCISTQFTEISADTPAQMKE